MAAHDRLWFTENDEANKLLAEDPFALLVGFALDQQITVQQAFLGPLRIKQRVGSRDPATIARTDLEPVLNETAAVHPFPGSTAEGGQAPAAVIADADRGHPW